MHSRGAAEAFALQLATDSFKRCLLYYQPRHIGLYDSCYRRGDTFRRPEPLDLRPMNDEDAIAFLQGTCPGRSYDDVKKLLTAQQGNVQVRLAICSPCASIDTAPRKRSTSSLTWIT
jgi:hypothetical protein